MSKMTERARTYRLPNPSTPEDLECRWSKTIRFGDKVILVTALRIGADRQAATMPSVLTAGSVFA